MKITLTDPPTFKESVSSPPKPKDERLAQQDVDEKERWAHPDLKAHLSWLEVSQQTAMETFDEANPTQSRMRVTIYQRTVADNDKTPLVPFAINPMPLVLNSENLQHVGLSVQQAKL
ncbi:hypothetical protein N7453_003476 [Penicillium expansum]|nr:hypothetical protein N7453_003476 [Penicillium expansum]